MTRLRTLLVTGGTGSFGSTVARRLLDSSGVGEIRILSRDEAKQDDLRRWLNDVRARFYVGDVRDPKSVSDAMAGVDYVFHAAALKQVPSCEFFPLQAVATNVHGSDNVLRAAHEHGVKSVVCLSTDKAVYPINAMGLSKAMMEKVAQAFARNHPDSETVVSVTRYGNVMYSRGSVIPLFVEQLRAGRPLTVTDPGMTRFLMSLAESVSLVEYAFENARPGDLFVRKAPAATVAELARALALVLDMPDPEVQVIGTRHGEKHYESLLSQEEMATAEDLGEYYRVPLDARSLNYGLFVEEGSPEIDRSADYTSHNTRRLNVEEICEVLLEGVDSVVHLAGVNRSAEPSEVESVNPWLAEQLVDALRIGGSSAAVVYGNSIHARGDSPFGHAKREAGRILGEWGVSSGRPVSDVHIPNVFGEHGRPRYNSFVATFCHEIAAGRTPEVVDDKVVPLVHAQRVAAALLDLAVQPSDGEVDIPGEPRLVSGIREMLLRMSDDYRNGTLPRLDDPFVRDMFNTYRSATFPEQWPVHPPVNSDPRGRLSEAVKAGGGQAQVFYSLTNPGFTRGQHFHLGKVERFLVLRGTGEIRLRRLFTDEVVTFAVDGDTPAMVDMPTMWVHSITNTGSDDLITLFYADEIFDPCTPDTYPEEV